MERARRDGLGRPSTLSQQNFVPKKFRVFYERQIYSPHDSMIKLGRVQVCDQRPDSYPAKVRQAPALQDVCIFCAIRIQLSSTRTRLSNQRRPFRSGNAPNRPPAAAAARQDDQQAESLPQNAQSTPGGFTPPQADLRRGPSQSTWGKVPRFIPPSPPQPEEVKREEVRREAVTPQVLSTRLPQRPQRHQPTIRKSQSSSHFESATRNITLDRIIGAVKTNKPREVAVWRCKCGYRNKHSNLKCEQCHAPSPDYQRRLDDPNIAQTWKHVKRNGVPSGPEPTKEAARPREPVIDRALDEARQKRSEQSRQGNFVGLESKFRKAPLDFREVPKRSEQVSGQNGFQADRGRSSIRREQAGRGRGGFDGSRESARHGPTVATSSNARTAPSSNEAQVITRQVQELVESTARHTAPGGWKKWAPPPAPPVPESPVEPPGSVAPQRATIQEGRWKGSTWGRSELQDIREPYEDRPRHDQRYSRQPEGRREHYGHQPKQSDVTRDSSPGHGGSAQEEKAPAGEPNSKPTAWKAWSPAHAKADFKGNFPGETPIKSKSVYATDYDADYLVMNEDMQEQVTQYGPTEEMKARERQATESRMTKRMQQLEEASKSSQKKPAPARFDTNRERRSNIVKERRHIEKLDDYYDNEDDGPRMRQERKKQKKRQQMAEKLQGPPTPIYLPEFISVANLAGALRIKIEDFTSKMANLGFEETNNDHILDAETAGLIAVEFNFEPIVEQEGDQDLMPRPPAEDKSLLPSRPPVVTIMGHVDHGKTTLLDWLRKSSVAATEHGGITQHIGAFSVPMPSGRIITFLDTPGHAAFLDMRQRGANVTDIVILVVAADDSVKPQTVEAIKHSQAAKVPMIVAVNKIDKEDADVEKVKQDLARYGVEIEDYGGDTQVVGVSGKTGQGMETLEESVVALADILDMRAEIDGQAEGWVLEATTKKAGRVATVLVRRGTLHPGDIIVAGTTWARVRTLHNEAGVVVDSAGPGTPVEIDGWKDQPAAGDEVLQAEDEQHARSVIAIRLEAAERIKMATDMTAVNEARRLEQERREAAEAAEQAAKAAAAEGVDAPPLPVTQAKDNSPGFKEVPLLVKADVSGSVEAILASVLALGNNSVRASILRSGVGPISEFDVSHAASAQGHIVAFNLVTEQNIRRAAESSGVKLLEQNIIYRLVDQVKGVLEDYLEPERTKRVLGEAEVAQVFDINVKGRTTLPVAGCRVRNGVVARNAKVMVRREGEVVFDGESSIACLLFQS